jgi:putative tryptophan/tyrosine transport system substrate-binding protein
MRRREALSGLVLMTAAPRLFAQAARKLTVAVLIPFPETDAESQLRRAAFASGLEKLGWRDGHNLRLEVRHGVGDAQLRQQIGELATLNPAVLLVQSNQALSIAREQNSAITTVFVAVSDPVGSGYVASLSRPGGNTTGFTNFEPQTGGKWLQILKELAPRIESVSLLLNPTISANLELARSAEAAAVSLGIVATSVASRDAAALDKALAGLAGKSNAGIVVLPNPTNTLQQKKIIEFAALHRLPAIYPFSYYARNGGLASYGVDIKEMFRQAAAYVDRILKGAAVAELPVQQPTKYELVINQRTARALGLNVPGSLRVRSDEVIE